MTPTRTPLLLLAIFAGAARADDVEYNRDVRPILAENCFKCHGPAAKKGGFRLDVREDAVKPAKSGAAPIVVGKPAESELVKRIFTDDAETRMPPANSHKTLKVNEKELLKRWIAEGANYQKHWAFEPVVVKTRPKGHPIDAFILARLQREGLKLSPEADRPTLIRRVAFALTGLPPTVAEVDRFVGDKSRDAYEQMVDRYLGSKHYGEEMARHWLDLARYADTHGLHSDNERQCICTAIGWCGRSMTICCSIASPLSKSLETFCPRRQASK